MQNLVFQRHVTCCAFRLSIALVLMAACRREPAVPPPIPEAAQPDTGADRDSLERAMAARRDSVEREERLREERERRMAVARDALQQPVFFDYDRADLTAETRLVLDAKLPLLSASVEVRLRISGHADERGSDEYNLALGQRRAASAKRYLVDHGIDAGRVDIVSFGEERPMCTDATESCWSRNRRAEFEITAGADRIVTP
jgi:peptidoglycan-associated lipoprotein